MRKKKKSDKPCFQQKKVVIIGAAGGLGMTYTEMFLREGAAVYLGCRSVDAISEQYGDNEQRIKIGYVDL